jgi:hypothetical protein
LEARSASALVLPPPLLLVSVVFSQSHDDDDARFHEGHTSTDKYHALDNANILRSVGALERTGFILDV